MSNHGINVRYFREKKFPGHGGQALAAAKAKVSRSSWNNYETRERLSHQILVRIAKVLDVTVDDLIAGPSDMAVTLPDVPLTDRDRAFLAACLSIQQGIAQLAHLYLEEIEEKAKSETVAQARQVAEEFLQTLRVAE